MPTGAVIELEEGVLWGGGGAGAGWRGGEVVAVGGGRVRGGAAEGRTAGLSAEGDRGVCARGGLSTGSPNDRSKKQERKNRN